jgi:phage shock protein C
MRITMELADHLALVHALYQSGALTDEEFAQAKARLLNDSAASTANAWPAGINTLRRSRTDRWLGGVCGGLAKATGLEPWVWRLAVSALTLLGGVGLVLYLLLWIFVPSA